MRRGDTLQAIENHQMMSKSKGSAKITISRNEPLKKEQPLLVLHDVVVSSGVGKLTKIASWINL